MTGLRRHDLVPLQEIDRAGKGHQLEEFEVCRGDFRFLQRVSQIGDSALERSGDLDEAREGDAVAAVLILLDLLERYSASTRELFLREV